MGWSAFLSSALLQVAGTPLVDPSSVIGPDVVVTARSLTDTEDSLRRCLVRHCPPGEDIQASLAHAENQFVSGDFHGSRQTLVASRGRNKRFARDLPQPVAELLRVDAFVAQLLGLRDYGRIGTIDSVSALKAGLPKGDERIARQRLLVAAVFAREGRFDTAINMYDAVAERAAEAGWPALQADAMFRSAALYNLLASVDPAYLGGARRRLKRLQALREPEARAYVDAAVLIEATIARMNKDERALAVARARSRTMRVDRAMLFYAPPIELNAPSGRQGNVVPAVDTRDQWIDVSFNVAPDGRVRDVEAVGRGKRATGRWIDIALESLGQREYLPLDQAKDGPGIGQLERFVLVTDRGLDTATHIVGPVGPPRVRSVNLTARSSNPASAALREE